MSRISLPMKVLKKRALLPEKLSDVRLKGDFVRLELLEIERDAQRLFEISNGSTLKLGNRSMNSYDADELIWRCMFDGPFNNVEELASSLQLQVNSSNRRCMCVFEVFLSSQIGVANFVNNTPSHLKIELGGI